jgi:hypothetical protein
MKRVALLALVWLSFALAGCGHSTDPNVEQAKAIIRLPVNQRPKALAELPLNKQLDVYLYAATRVEPPLVLAKEVASNGPSILPTVRDRLAAEADDRRFTQLMLILVAVSASQCSLEKRADILDVVQRAIPRMKEENRETANHLLEAIKHPEKQLPPCS